MTALVLDLPPEQVKQLAELVADRVVERLGWEPIGGELIDAAEVARRFCVSRDFVYQHSDDLGAVRLGSGPRARLRFDPATVGEKLTGLHRREVPRKAEPVRTVHAIRSSRGVALLPIRGTSL